MSLKQKITVAIPVYNGQKYILEALQSIVDQTQKVDDIIVCDNKSTDNTVNIVKDFFHKHTNFNCLLHQNPTNLGYQKNFNKCMELTDSGYLLLLAADDRLKYNTIEVSKNFLDQNNEYALTGGYADTIDKFGDIIEKHETKSDQHFRKGEILEFLKLNRLYLIPSSVLIRIEFIKKVGFWDLYLGPDERYWPRVIQQYPIAILSNCLVDRRVHNEQTAIIDYAKKFQEVIKSLKENLKVALLENNPERERNTKRLIRQQNSSSSFMMGNLVIKQYSEYGKGIKYLLFGIQQAPSFTSKVKLIIKANKIILYSFIHFLRQN